MAIRTIVTRGFGNGTYNGAIRLVVTRGYLEPVPVVPTKFAKLPARRTTASLPERRTTASLPAE